MRISEGRVPRPEEIRSKRDQPAAGMCEPWRAEQAQRALPNPGKCLHFPKVDIELYVFAVFFNKAGIEPSSAKRVLMKVNRAEEAACGCPLAKQEGRMRRISAYC